MTDSEKLDLLLQQQEDIRQQQEEMRQQQKEMRQQQEGMRQQIDRIDSRLDNQEHRLNGVDIHVTQVLEMDAKLTRLENFIGDVQTFNRRLRSLDGHITNTNTILATHTAELAEIKQRLDMMPPGLDGARKEKRRADCIVDRCKKNYDARPNPVHE